MMYEMLDKFALDLVVVHVYIHFRPLVLRLFKIVRYN